jgi:plastocyanin
MKRILVAAALACLPFAANAQSVSVTLSEWKVAVEHDTVPAGLVTFKVKNTGSMNHGFYVRGPGVAKGTKEIPAGQEAPLTVTLKAGTYELYCPLSDMSHRTAGMTHTIVVTGEAKPAATKKPGN